jgi:hypothetical protein
MHQNVERSGISESIAQEWTGGDLKRCCAALEFRLHSSVLCIQTDSTTQARISRPASIILIHFVFLYPPLDLVVSLLQFSLEKAAGHIWPKMSSPVPSSFVHISLHSIYLKWGKVGLSVRLEMRLFCRHMKKGSLSASNHTSCDP